MTNQGGRVRTVLGDIPPADLGRTDYHEHLLMRSPLLRNDALTDVRLSGDETLALRDAGMDAIAELSPIGTGRDPIAVHSIAERTKMHIILATGVHREAHYPPEHWAHRVSEDALAALFVRDIEEGCDGNDYQGPLERPTSVRAGVIKTGASYWSISSFEMRVLTAAAEAYRTTGAAIVVHLEHGTAGPDVLDELNALGVPASRVCLAHCDRNPDPGLHAELIASGATLGYDGMARAKYWPDSVLLDCLVATVERAREPRIVLGGDVARRSAFVAYGGRPGMAYLPQRFVPRLTEQLGVDLVDTLLVTNPARLFTLCPAHGTEASPGG